jgi:hypothetical protein
MGWPDIFTQVGLFPGSDVRATQSNSNQSRSESVVAINPTDTSNLIAASKKFIDPVKYHFTVAAVFSKSGGGTWTEATLPANFWDGMTDPVLAFNHLGHAFLVVEPLRFDPNDITVTGIQVFRSTNGGQTWSSPQSLIEGRDVDHYDDKSWIACDRSNNLSTRGRIYVAWGVGAALRLARSLDGGQTWRGTGNLPAGANVPGTSGVYAPETTVDYAGKVHVVWHLPGSSTINYTRSVDGGETFEPQKTIATGVAGLREPYLPKSGDWAEFPNAKFRVLTLATGCALPSGRFIVTWADMRDGVSRLYYRMSDDGGATWIGPQNGQPLLPWFAANNGLYHFHPQLIATESGVVGCAFYEFGLKSSGYKIDTRVAGSFSQGDSFDRLTTVTDIPWDPAINAPLSHGNPSDTFIGEYFGFDADNETFAVIWTDTRTGVQELFYDEVRTTKTVIPDEFEGISAEVSGGVASGGGGFIIVGGKIIKIPPRGPKWALIQSMIALDAAEQIDHPAGPRLVRGVTETIVGIAKDMGKQT